MDSGRTTDKASRAETNPPGTGRQLDTAPADRAGVRVRPKVKFPGSTGLCLAREGDLLSVLRRGLP